MKMLSRNSSSQQIRRTRQAARYKTEKNILIEEMGSSKKNFLDTPSNTSYDGDREKLTRFSKS